MASVLSGPGEETACSELKISSAFAEKEAWDPKPFWLKSHFGSRRWRCFRAFTCLFWCVRSFASTSDVHGTPWMAGHRGAAGVVQCDPWASSAISAVATGTEVPSASEDAQCVSCTTHEGSWWSSFCAEIPMAAQVARVVQLPLQRRSWSVHAVVQHSWSQPCSCWMPGIPR